MIIGLAMTFLLVGLAIFALEFLRDDGKRSEGDSALANGVPPQVSVPFEVAGASMVPTLFGESCSVVCGRCQNVTRVTPLFPQILERNRTCAICAGTLEKSGQTQVAAVAGQPAAADVVLVNPLTNLQKQQLQRGDVVAVNYQGRLRVKRIAGIAGDLISTPDGRICINDERLEDKLAPVVNSSFLAPERLLVDRDLRQSKSRWEPASEVTAWTRDQARQWKTEFDPGADASKRDWLIYHHRDVHSKNAAGEVVDDYQFNLDIARRLVAVDRLAVSLNARISSPCTFCIAFWTPAAVRVARTELRHSGSTKLSFYDASGSAKGESEFPRLTRMTPAAIRIDNTSGNVASGNVWLGSLSVERFVEYRLRPSDDDSIYPLRLAAGQVYVVGDNVPVSDDSRVWGAISLDDIVGSVSKTKSLQPSH